jgi:hypothetical protein
MMLIRPQGLLGGKEIWPRYWRRRAGVQRGFSPLMDPGSPKAEPVTTLEGGAASLDTIDGAGARGTEDAARTAGRVP